jgi:two-component system NarL family sensor kinase
MGANKGVFIVGRLKTRQRSVSVELICVTIAAAIAVFLWRSRVHFMPGESVIIAAIGALLLALAPIRCLAVMTRRAARFKALLRQVLRELAAARQTERNRTARELHDGVCQLLIAVRHSLELAAERRSVPHEFDAFFSRGLQQLGDAIRETRRVSHDLKSVLLTEHLLPEALEYLGREFAGRTHVQMDLTHIETAVDEMLTTPAKGALLRITQEALANIQKHSGASHVELAMEHCTDHVELRVADNGRGFADQLASGTSRGGIGISNMRERAVALGGTLSLHSTGSRTEVIARLPITRPRASRRHSLHELSTP